MKNIDYSKCSKFRNFIFIIYGLFIFTHLYISCSLRPKLIEGEKKAKWLKKEMVIVGISTDSSKTIAATKANANAYKKAIEEFIVNIDKIRTLDSLISLYLLGENKKLNDIQKEFIIKLINNYYVKYKNIQKWEVKDSVYYIAYIGLKIKDTTNAWQLEFINNKMKDVHKLLERAINSSSQDDIVKNLEFNNQAYFIINNTSKLIPDDHVQYSLIKENVENIQDNINSLLKNLDFNPPIRRVVYSPGTLFEKPFKVRLFYQELNQTIYIRQAELNLDYDTTIIKMQFPDEIPITNVNGIAEIKVDHIEQSNTAISLNITPVFKKLPKGSSKYLRSSKIIFQEKDLPLPPGPMIFINGGIVRLGKSSSDPVIQYDEIPGVEVWVDPFWIDEHEVTNEQYQKFLDGTNYKRKPMYFDIENLASNDQPVVGVTWEDAKTYADWAGKRLPTEAEWQLAAQGFDAKIYPWGNEFYSHLCANSYNSQRPSIVARYEGGKSPFGVYDMAGNVWEWCNDWYDNDILKKQKSGEHYNPPATGTLKVIRGGSWKSNSIELRCSNRLGMLLTTMTDNIGFRCVRDEK